jgi:hypothetical protein
MALLMRRGGRRVLLVILSVMPDGGSEMRTAAQDLPFSSDQGVSPSSALKKQTQPICSGL